MRCESNCLCGKHNGDASYVAKHFRVYERAGKASDKNCVDCGKQARDWSQIHGTEGLSTDDYEPRCRTCHCAYDGRPKGEDRPNAKLTSEEVIAMRDYWDRKLFSQRELAQMFEISSSTVQDVVERKSWKHV